jgi:hypothetical protein
MNFRNVLVAPMAAAVLSAGAAELRMPTGWYDYSMSAGVMGKAYEVGIDPAVKADGVPSLEVRSAAPLTPGPISFGLAYQSVSGYGGKRLRFSGQLKAEAVQGWAGLYLDEAAFMRFVTVFAARPGAEKQLPAGTAVPADGEWHEISVVKDVSADALEVGFGLTLVGQGRVWARRLRFEVVGPEVAPTATTLHADLEQARRYAADARVSLSRLSPMPLQNPKLD